MRIVVAIPWRATPDRIRAHIDTTERYIDLLPDADIVNVDAPGEPFSLAAARNAGVQLAEERGADVVVIGDADTLPELRPLNAAVAGAFADGLVHLPFTEYRSLRDLGSVQYRAGIPLDACDHLVVEGACSGVYVTMPATWWAHGGQDERFRGWGGEDAAWWCAHTALLGVEPVRHHGRVYSLTHEPAVKEGVHYTTNFALVHRYHLAQNDSAAMRALVVEQRARHVCRDEERTDRCA